MSKLCAVWASYSVRTGTYRHPTVLGAARHSISEPKTVAIFRCGNTESPVHVSP